MALPISIENLLNGQIVESQRIEYKEGWDPKPILHTITAFANDYEGDSGGYVLIGVKAANGIPVLPISGLKKEDVDRIQGEILELCKRNISNGYCPRIEATEYDGQSLIVLYCYNGYDTPYYCREHIYSKQAETKTCYIRKGSSTIKATKSQIQELDSLSQIIPFDDRANKNADLNDIKPYLVRDYLSMAKSSLLDDFDTTDFTKIMNSLRLLSGGKEDAHPKNAALLMFNDRPDDFLPYSYIVVDYIPDPTGEGMITKEFKGPLYRQILDCLQYIENRYLEKKTLKLPDRAQSLTIENYPYAAMEELIPNAVLHKDYRIPEPVTIRITNDEIQITNFPGISPTITDDRIQKQDFISRSYRNKVIAEFLKDVELVDAKNTGMPKVIKALKRNGSPDLVIEMPENREYVTVIMKIHPSFMENKTPDHGTDRSSNVFARVLAYIKENPYQTITEISNGLGYKNVSNSLKLALSTAVSNGTLIKEGKRYRFKD